MLNNLINLWYYAFQPQLRIVF